LTNDVLLLALALLRRPVAMLSLVRDLFRPDNLAVAVAAALLWLQLFQLLVCARLQHNVAVPVAVQMRLLSVLLPWLAWALLALLTFRIFLPHRAQVYRANHELSEVVNTISVFVFVIADNSEVPSRLKVLSDFNRFIFSPARTPDGHANLCYDHVRGTNSKLTLHCDPATGRVSIRDQISKNRVRNAADYLVLIAGEAVTETTSKKLEEWARRPKMQAATLPVTSPTEIATAPLAQKRKRTVVSSDDDELNVSGPPVPDQKTSGASSQKLLQQSSNC
jgi:hypothetical protein